MRRRLLLCCILFLTSIHVWALGIPSWVKRLPQAGNETYYYRVTKAEGKTYEEAYTRAFSMAILESEWKIGVRTFKQEDAKTIEESLKQDLKLKSSPINLPINKVCEYEQASPNGGIILYCLWQVASYGNVKAEFENYLNCE